MKQISAVCLAGLVFLSGCATQNTAPKVAQDAKPTADSDALATTPESAPESSLFGRFGFGNNTLPLQPVTLVPSSSRQVAPLFAPSDLWDRMRRGFAMPNLQHDLVQDREQWYASRPDYILRMTERSSKYLFYIVEELERRGMPTELALLPYIESAFNPQAVSSAKAAGMWQFMPATGNYFDLKQNVFRDDRRDVLASTRAALDYLQKLHGMFGDWHLALAAYNWGEGNVGRAIARNQKAGLGLSYAELNMPAETRMYVPKLQAVKNIVAQPSAFNADLPLIENHPYFQTVEITRDMDVALAARLAGVREEDFRALNPSLHKPVILAAGTPQILLPWDNAKVFERNLQAHTQGQYASWTVWTVPSTMSPADAAQRVGMNEAELRSINHIPPRMLIKAGSALMVPRSTTMREDVTGRVADSGQMALTPEMVTRRTTVRAGKRDSVASLAQRHHLSAANVAEWNGVKPGAAFKPGQQVVLYLPMQVKSTVASAHRGRNAPATRQRAQAANRTQATAKRGSAAPVKVARAGGKTERR
ncbi:MAG: transglycosylase SLT domain-containing protein [Burkholderiaceae bacterium]|nr:transglycosylase SLT domain-containing protein [Burkholderiaceae bacterium]